MGCQHQSFVEGCPDCALALTQGSSSPLAPLTSVPPRGATVGRYILLDRIGEGGMGLVFVAYDPELDRKVAIKLLRGQTSDSDTRTEGQARMLREAQAMARLSHPNVVSVYDVGTFQDGVFLAMEYVEGETLAQWSRQKARPWREVVDVLAAAGQGLFAAHQAGIIHRDFKPANVLIGKDGRVRVTDFGLARAADLAAAPERATRDPILLTQPVDASSAALRTPLTLAGSMMGTPGYMAPEQYGGQLTTPQTDQFSFCVSLYEALYQTLPFHGSTVGELSSAVATGRIAPPPPGSRVPTRLRQLALRGLIVDPARRFPSMEPLLTELRRDPSRNRRRWVAGAGLAMLVVVAFVSIRYWSLKRVTVCRGADLRMAGVWDEETRARIRQQFVDTGAPFAPQAWTAIYRRLNDYTVGWAQAFTDTCESTRVRGEQSEQVLDLRMACLDDELKELTALTQLFRQADPKIVENALAAAEQLPTPLRCADVSALRAAVPLPTDDKQVAKIKELQGNVVRARELQHAGKFKEALVLGEKTAQEADTLNYAPLQAEAWQLLSETQGTVSDSPEALRSSERAFRAAEAAHQERLVALILIDISSMVGNTQNHPEQGRVFAQLAAGAIARIGHDDSLESKLQRSLGSIAWREGALEESARYYREALRLQEKNGAADDINVAPLIADLGWVLVDLGKMGEARRALDRAAQLREQALGPDHPSLIASLNDLARLSLAEGNYQDAIARLERASTLVDRTFGPDSPRQCALLNNIGQVLAANGQTGDALRTARRGVQVCRNAKGPNDTATAMAQMTVGTVLRLDGRPAEAMQAHRVSRALLEPKVGVDHPLFCQQWIEESQDLLDLGRSPQALAAAQKALQCDERNKVEGPNLSDGLTAEGRAYLQMGKLKEASVPLQKALDIRVASKVAASDMGEVQFALAKALWPHHKAESASLTVQARQSYDKAGKTKAVKQVIAWQAAHP